MQVEDPQALWADYYDRKRAQRMHEAAVLWAGMKQAGVTGSTVLALDFVHFGSVRSDVESLAAQLSGNYTTRIVADSREGYWRVLGTTRPGGVCLEEDQHMAWVGFMSDVARSYACVFSTWTIEAVALGLSFRSEDLESAS